MVPYYYNSFLQPKILERKDLFFHGNITGLAMAIVLSVQASSSFLLIALYMYMKNVDLLEASKSMIKDIPFLLLTNLFLTAIIFTLPFIMSANILGYKIKKFISFDKPQNMLSLIFIAMGFFALGQVLSMVVSYLFSLVHLKPQAPDLGQPTDFLGISFLIFTGAIAPAIFEEFAFRGVVLNSLKKFGNLPAIFISSLLFAFMHGNFVQIPFAFCAGIGLGICYVKSKSIWTSVIAHFINNTLAFLSPLIYKLSPKIIADNLDIVLVIIMFIVATIGVFLYHKKNGNIFRREHTPSYYSATKRTFIVLGSPLIIFSLLSFLVFAILGLFSVQI